MSPPQKAPPIQQLLQNGLALHQAGRGLEAMAFYRQVLALDANQPAANHLLGLVYLQQGNPAEAVERISRAVQASPSEPQYLGNLGVAQNAAGQHAEAVTSLQRAIALKPGFAEALSNLGMALRALRRHDEAVTAYRRAVALRPKEPGFHFNLANALRDAGHVADAETSYRQSLSLRPGYSAATSAFAALLDEQGRSQEALGLIDIALNAQPTDAQLHLRRARALYRLNRLGDAIDSFNRAIEFRPSFGEAHLQRAYARRHEAHDSAVDAMQALLESEETPVEDRIFAGFGLGKALTDVGNPPASIAAFQTANRLNRQRISYSVDNAIAELTADLQRFDGVADPTGDGGDREDSDVPAIFIVGMPRAGKTTIETLLSRHAAVAAAGELPIMGRLVGELLRQYPGVPARRIPPDRLTELGRAYLREARALVPSGKTLVDTMPSNYRHIGFIRLALPNARIVQSVRSTPEHCVAIFEKYLTSAGYEYASDMDELQRYHAAVGAMMRQWHARFPGHIHDIDTGNLTRDRHNMVRGLLDFCGLAWDEACMADVRSELQYGDWSADRIAQSQADHMAAWRTVRPQLWK